MSEPKLTKAQQRIMDVVNEHGAFQFAEGYKPAEKLIALGLVKVHRGNFGLCTLERPDHHYTE